MTRFSDLSEYTAIPAVNSLCLSPDGSWLAAVVQTVGTDPKKFHTSIWRVDTGQAPAARLTRSADVVHQRNSMAPCSASTAGRPQSGPIATAATSRNWPIGSTPTRSSLGISPVRSTIVDCVCASHGPPSR